MVVIDLHAHAVLEATFGAAGPYGPELDESGAHPSFRVGDYELRPAPYRGTVFMDVDARRQRMADLGIDLAMLSPNPLTFFGGIDSAAATAFARASNDAMADLVARHPDLLGSAQVPLQDVAAALQACC